MPTKWDVVNQLTRDELWQIVDDYNLAVEDRRKLDDLQYAVARLSKSDLRAVLLGRFDRDRLKQICRHLELDDAGKLKADIVDRLIKPPAVDDDEDSTARAGISSAPTGKNAPLLNLLILDELLDIIDQYGILVENRRRRDHVLVAVTQLSNGQLRTVLQRLSRDRLKELCLALNLDGDGKRKVDLTCRLLGEPAPVEDDDDGVAAKVQDARNKNQVVSIDDSKSEPSKGKKPRRPRLFVGSTTEALEIARAVQAELEFDADVTLWTQNVFGPNTSIWTQLITLAREGSDFALFVFSGDDAVESHGITSNAPRDNVLLEYGLFVGAHGLEKTFILVNHDRPVKIASDLAGIPPLEYLDRSDGNLQAAVATACHKLRKLLKADYK